MKIFSTLILISTTALIVGLRVSADTQVKRDMER